MYDETLLTVFIQSLLTGSFIIYYIYFVIKKFIIYELKKSLYFELYVFKNIATKNIKEKLKKSSIEKKKNEKQFIKKSFIFILILNTLLLIFLFIRFLLNPKKFTITLKTILSNIKGILLLEIVIILGNSIVLLSCMKFIMIPYNSIIIKSSLSQYLFENILFFL